MGKLIDAIKANDRKAVESLIGEGADVNEQDEQGWTPLCFAAGKGSLEIVKLLIENGADRERVGRDRRTPYMIAFAAARVEVMKFLSQLDADSNEAGRPARSYCKAYPLGALRGFSEWSTRQTSAQTSGAATANHGQSVELADDEIVYIHQDFSVTRSVWRDEQVILGRVSSEWIEFCVTVLGFNAPSDLELARSAIRQG
jgi:ankyrin repeat protein